MWDGKLSDLTFSYCPSMAFSLFGHTAWMPVKTRAKILTASPWRTGGDHQDDLVLREWRLSSRARNPVSSPWMKQLMWLRIVHSGDWCLRLLLRTPSGTCQKRRRRKSEIPSDISPCTFVSIDTEMTRWQCISDCGGEGWGWGYIVHHVIVCQSPLIVHSSCSLHCSFTPLTVHTLHLDWIEQCFTSPPTQYRLYHCGLYGRWFLQVKRPNQQYQSTERTNSTQTNQTHNKQTWTQNTASPLVYNNMGWLGDGSHAWPERRWGCRHGTPTLHLIGAGEIKAKNSW